MAIRTIIKKEKPKLNSEKEDIALQSKAISKLYQRKKQIDNKKNKKR